MFLSLSLTSSAYEWIISYSILLLLLSCKEKSGVVPKGLFSIVSASLAPGHEQNPIKCVNTERTITSTKREGIVMMMLCGEKNKIIVIFNENRDKHAVYQNVFNNFSRHIIHPCFNYKKSRTYEYDDTYFCPL